MAKPRIFTVDEVNALLPRLNFLVGAQLQRRASIDAKLERLANTLAKTGDGPSTTLAVRETDAPAVQSQKRDIAALVAEYEAGWSELEGMGGVLKDPRLGLVDFYGRVQGTLVWLCWKYGEDRIDHFHALEEGFGGRKRLPEPIRPMFLN